MQLPPPKNTRESLFRALKLVGFNGDEHHLGHHVLGRRLGLLSSGELQRVLIAAALLDKPDVLLFDEPTSGVDVGSEGAIYERLKKMNKEEKFTMLLISHDLSVVHKFATSVLCLNKKAVCFGEPHSAITPDVLTELYGKEKAFYRHNHEIYINFKIMEHQFLISLIVGIAVGAASGFLGSFMILKRMALVGDALTHVALPGIGLALILGFNPFIGAFVLLFLAMILIWKLEQRTDLPIETIGRHFFRDSFGRRHSFGSATGIIRGPVRRYFASGDLGLVFSRWLRRQ